MGDLSPAKDGVMALHFAAPWIWAALPAVALFVSWQGAHSYANLPRRRRRLTLGLRLAVLTTLIAALSQPVLVRQAPSSSTVLLVDVSRSVPERVLDGARALARGANFTVVTFGSRPRLAVGGKIERHDEDGSDLAQAILFARGLGRDARLALIGDGQYPHLEAVERALDGVELSLMRLAVPPPIDARVSGVRLPDVVRQGEPARATVAVEAQSGGAAMVRFEENGNLVEERAVTLAPGSQSFAFEFEPSVSGLVPYRAEVRLPGDEFPGNDSWAQLAFVSGAPRLLLVADPPEEGSHLEEALTAQGLHIDSVTPTLLPTATEQLLSYDAVILAGIAPFDLDRLREAALTTFVRDTGGGLLFVAGRRGLRRDLEGRPHPLENLLPVEMVAPSEREEPPVALVLLIDRSGSMTGEKLDFAKQAALRVIDTLGAHDKLGVMAFDAKFEWILPLGPIEDKDRVKATVGSLGAGGGTRFLPALEEAYYSLATTDAGVRHAVLLTDGVSTDPNVFPELLAKARQRSVTVSTVAIGNGADVKLLAEIAKLGGGRYTLATRASEVPQIFVKETQAVQREAAQRGDTPARLALAARELAGIDFAGAPPLKGYLRTRAKAGSELLLEAPSHDPLLVRWQYGLGRVMAFTSDATAAWGERWVRWSGFGQFWSQLARAVERPRRRHDLELTMKAEGSTVRFTMEAGDADGRLLNDCEAHVQVLDAAEAAHDVPLAQIAPGRYQGEMMVAEGTLLARTWASLGGRRLEGDWTVLARPYSDELAHIGDNRAVLEALARSGGVVGDAAQLAGPGKLQIVRASNLGVPLVLLALLLLLADLTAKRAQWERRT
jgi:uncharacterized membrane protein